MGPMNRNRLPRAVWALGWVSFFADVASEMVFPILPSFIASTLGAGAAGLGIVEGIADSTASIFKLISGWISDRLPKRLPLVVGGYSLTAISRPLIGMATGWPMVAVFRFFDRMGKGLRTAPRDAVLSTSVDASMRGRAFGLHRSMDHAGAVVGPLICAALLWSAVSIRQFFYWALIPGLLAVACILLFVREDAPAPSNAREERSAEDGSKIPSAFRKYLVCVGLFSLGNSSDAFLLFRFQQHGVALAWIAVLWAAHHLVKSFSTYFGGTWADRFGRMPMIILGWAVFCIVYLCFGFAATTWLMAAVFMLYGVYFGLSEPAEKAVVADLVPAESRGSAFGLFHGTVGIMALPASVLFGLLWAKFGAGTAFGFGAALAIAASTLLVVFVRPELARHTGT